MYKYNGTRENMMQTHFEGRELLAFINDTSLVAPRQFDIVGLSIYCGFIALCISFVLYKLVFVKSLRRKKTGDPLLCGAVRWAAASGDVKTLDELSLAPEFDVNSAIDGFTALHAAVIGGKRGTNE